MTETPAGPRRALAQPGVSAASQMLTDVIGRVALLEDRLVNLGTDLSEAMAVQKDNGDASARVAREIAELKALVAQLGAEEEEPPPRVVDWTTLDVAAAEQQWEILYEWLDTFLVPTYLISDSTLFPCWPAHPAVRDELSALRMAWVDAYQGPHASSGRVTEWLLRHRAGALANVEALLKTTECSEGEHLGQPLPAGLPRAVHKQPLTRAYWLDDGRRADLAARAARATAAPAAPPSTT